MKFKIIINFHPILLIIRIKLLWWRKKLIAILIKILHLLFFLLRATEVKFFILIFSKLFCLEPIQILQALSTHWCYWYTNLSLMMLRILKIIGLTCCHHLSCHFKTGGRLKFHFFLRAINFWASSNLDVLSFWILRCRTWWRAWIRIHRSNILHF